MPVFWYDGLSLGHEDIDRQHQGLFSLVNELETSLKEQRSLTIMADVVERLNMYATDHFAAEERLMRENAYAGLEAHQQAHELFIEKVMSFNFMPDAYLHPGQELYQFLRDWLIAHIRKVDQVLVAHLGQAREAGTKDARTQEAGSARAQAKEAGREEHPGDEEQGEGRANALGGFDLTL